MCVNEFKKIIKLTNITNVWYQRNVNEQKKSRNFSYRKSTVTQNITDYKLIPTLNSGYTQSLKVYILYIEKLFVYFTAMKQLILLFICMYK